jgi:hypothetical protein
VHAWQASGGEMREVAAGLREKGFRTVVATGGRSARSRTPEGERIWGPRCDAIPVKYLLDCGYGRVRYTDEYGRCQPDLPAPYERITAREGDRGMSRDACRERAGRRPTKPRGTMRALRAAAVLAGAIGISRRDARRPGGGRSRPRAVVRSISDDAARPRRKSDPEAQGIGREHPGTIMAPSR